MALNLMSILQGAQALPTDPTVTDEIVVSGNRSAGPDPYVDNRVPPSPQMQEEIVPRQGMFGTRGTLRDILGVVGDAFLTQAGHERVYAPKRQQERVGDAMYGFVENPLAAIERMATVDPQMAQRMAEQYQNSQVKESQQASLAANRESLINNRLEGNIESTRDWAARLLYGAGGDPELESRALSLIQQQAQRLGVSMEDLGLPDSMTSEELGMYSTAGMTVPQQAEMPYKERRARVSEQNVRNNTRRTDAYVSRPAPRRRGNTRNEDYIEAASVPASERTEAQQAIVDAGPTGTPRTSTSSRGSGRGAGSGGGSLVRGPDGKVRFRPNN